MCLQYYDYCWPVKFLQNDPTIISYYIGHSYERTQDSLKKLLIV